MSSGSIGTCQFVTPGGHMCTREATTYAAIGLRWCGHDHSPPHVSEKVERNGPCPCGSGEKFKKCCGFRRHLV